MAKKNKQQDKFDFKAFQEQLKSQEQERKIEFAPQRKSFLVVTEGTRTEPYYFQAMIDELPHQLVEVEIIGQGRDTISVVRAAIYHRDKRKKQITNPPFDEVWAVFDKDDFPDEKFNEAIDLANHEDIGVAYSNEAFELWYVLHFQYLDTAISRKEYQKILEKKLGKYQKNDTEIYALLQTKGSEKQAIRSAKKLFKKFHIGNPAKEKPTTLVYKLVEKFNEFK